MLETELFRSEREDNSNYHGQGSGMRLVNCKHIDFLYFHPPLHGLKCRIVTAVKATEKLQNQEMKDVLMQINRLQYIYHTVSLDSVYVKVEIRMKQASQRTGHSMGGKIQIFTSKLAGNQNDEGRKYCDQARHEIG